MTENNNPALPPLDELIPAFTKTFVLAHAESTDQQLGAALVRNAGRLAWKLREAGVNVEQKEAGNISNVVTDADTAAEGFISGALRMLRPHDGVLGEEGANQASRSGKTWVIDPIDGTYNFATHSDYWCSAVAQVDGPLEDPNSLVFGAVHRPDMGYTWLGGPGQPTTRDGRPTSGIKTNEERPLGELSLGTYLHPTYMKDDGIRRAWMKVVERCATLRMFGAASVDLGGVADGTIGVWMQHSLPSWDWLPGKALVEGAGGVALQVEAGGVNWGIAGPRRAVEEICSLLEGMD